MAVVRMPKANNENKGLDESITKAIDAATAFAQSEKLEPLKCDTSIIVSLPKSIKNEWKAFFAARGLTLSFGVKIAVDHLIADVEAGRGNLRATGYIAK